MSNQNPYAAPQADVELPSSGNAIEIIKSLPRFTTWAVVGLSIITMGVYSIYWLYNRTKKLNAGLPDDKKISKGIVIGALISYIIYMIFSIVAPMVMPELAAIGGLFAILYFVLFIIWIYKFRGAINTLIATRDRKKGWIGPILTFFINIYYFQYKINQIHDNS